MPKQNFSHSPKGGTIPTSQPRETILMTELNRLCAFLVFFFCVCMFNCNIKVLNGKYVNNHVTD